ncbi:MAG: recombination mediator RecR [Patescibacteria group bacterium]
MYSDNIQKLIDKIARWPSIGPKTAERIVFYLLKQPRQDTDNLINALSELKEKITICQVCFNFSENNPCPICSDTKRDRQIICLVTKPQDVNSIEKTNSFSGLYHVLGGNINPLENISPQDIKIKELLDRIKRDQVKEVILALNPDLTGETTSLYLTKLIKQMPDIRISKLARGLPVGADLEYADPSTIESSLKGRQEL